jgi:hypothetical protein
VGGDAAFFWVSKLFFTTVTVLQLLLQAVERGHAPHTEPPCLPLALIARLCSGVLSSRHRCRRCRGCSCLGDPVGLLSSLEMELLLPLLYTPDDSTHVTGIALCEASHEL